MPLVGREPISAPGLLVAAATRGRVPMTGRVASPGSAARGQCGPIASVAASRIRFSRWPRRPGEVVAIETTVASTRCGNSLSLPPWCLHARLAPDLARLGRSALDFLLRGDAAISAARRAIAFATMSVSIVAGACAAFGVSRWRTPSGSARSSCNVAHAVQVLMTGTRAPAPRARQALPPRAPRIDEFLERDESPTPRGRGCPPAVSRSP